MAVPSLPLDGEDKKSAGNGSGTMIFSRFDVTVAGSPTVDL